MNCLQTNLDCLQIHQPRAWASLKAIFESPFELEDHQIMFLGRGWSLSETLAEVVPSPAQPVAMFVYGMGDGRLVQALRERLSAWTPIIVLDSQPELAWTLLEAAPLTELLSDPRLQWLIAKPDQLVVAFRDLRLQLQDQLEMAWLENPPIAQLGSLLNDAFLRIYRQEAQKQADRRPLDQLPAVEAIYRDLEAPMAQAYATYPLTCRSGCADCCHSSVGFHLCINPLEWALVHRSLIELPESERRAVFAKTVETLARHADYLVELLHTFDAQPDRLQDPAFHRELLEMAGTRRQEPCLLLDEQDRCRVYGGRPLTCRVFGNSHVQGRLAFTCDKDYDQIERILLAEGPRSRLVNSSAYRERLWQAHTGLEHKQVLNLWLLTHLDFEARDFSPLRLDYQQFQSLVRHPELLEQVLAELKAAGS